MSQSYKGITSFQTANHRRAAITQMKESKL